MPSLISATRQTDSDVNGIITRANKERQRARAREIIIMQIALSKVFARALTTVIGYYLL